MHCLYQILLVATFLPWCWLAMMAVHELGHVIAARATGGVVARVVLHPLALSRTDLSHNPSPCEVAWGGPLIGVLLPVAIWLTMAVTQLPYSHLARFFAGFCLTANGAYLAIGSFSRAGDAGDLVRLGVPNFCLWLFGLVTIPAGIFLWHRQGEHFGLGAARGKVDSRAAYLTAFLFAATVVLELAFA